MLTVNTPSNPHSNQPTPSPLRIRPAHTTRWSGVMRVMGVLMVGAMASASVIAPLHAQAEIPAHVERTGQRFSSSYGFPTFDWSGYQWGVRQSNGVIDWGDPQAKDPSDGKQKWINGAKVLPNGDLSIRSEGIGGGVEINAVKSTGYGTYTFEYSADFNAMDPHNVLGIFPYDMAEMELNKVDEVHENGAGSTEIDFIEISRWGSVDRALPHGGVTYYPDERRPWRPNSYVIGQFDIPPGQQRLTTIAEWEQDWLRVVTKTAEGRVLSDVYSTTRIPRDTGTQQLRINLWTTPTNRRAHVTAEPDEIIFHKFGYTPSIGSMGAPTEPPSGTQPLSGPVAGAGGGPAGGVAGAGASDGASGDTSGDTGAGSEDAADASRPAGRADAFINPVPESNTIRYKLREFGFGMLCKMGWQGDNNGYC